jgi:acylphosphatase
MVESLLKITGRVQGVFFRQSTQEKAYAFGVVGWVQNCSDGSVEALFQGDKQAVDELVRWCQKGPDHAHVEKVSVLYSKACTDACDRFTIR